MVRTQRFPSRHVPYVCKTNLKTCTYINIKSWRLDYFDVWSLNEGYSVFSATDQRMKMCRITFVVSTKYYTYVAK